MPGVVLSPNGDKATALFFHGDGSTTRVDIVFENGAWVIKGVTEIANK